MTEREEDSAMNSLLNRLRAAAGWGALLAAGTSCGGDAVGATSGRGGGSGGTGSDAGGAAGDASPGGADAGGAGGASGEGGTQPEAGADAPPEPRVPYPDPVGCFGPEHDGGYWGQRCEYVGCLEREDGACVSAAVARSRLSGAHGCACGSGPTGPYLPRDSSTEDECCYLYSWISCDGRPLTVAGVVRRAPPVRRADWARLGSAPTPPWERAA
ncbi:MAG: hypothetical protein IT376_16240 [Polyangiaceae bacterium]|nr:hypothetical protein [Polyangiaceae bacterium]